MSWQRRLLAHTLWVSFGILLGRLAGFVREAALAARFGASPEADVAVLLLTVPDMLLNLLVGGALSVAMIPEFKRLGSGPRAHALFLQGSLLTGMLFMLLAALFSYFAESLLVLVAPGLSATYAASAEALLAQVLWVIPLTALAGISTAYLQANERFVMPALGTFIYNVVLVVAILGLLDKGEPLKILVVAIIVAALLRWLSQLARLPRRPFAPRSLRWRLLHRPLLVRYLQALGAGGLITLLPVIARALASEQGEGSMALFNYAHKLVEFPLGVAITVLAVAIFPMLSHAFARGEDVTPAIRSALRWVLVLSMAVLTSLYLYRDLFADLTFGWGRMSPAVVAQLAELFGIGLLSLPLQGLSSLLLAIFNARRDTITPLRINAVVVGLFLPGAWLLAQVIGLRGIMVAMVLTYLLILAVQVVVLQRRHSIAVWSLLELPRVAGLLLLVTVVAVLSAMLRDVFAAGVILPLLGAVGTGIMLLFAGLFVMGEGQTLVRRLTHRER